MYKKFSIDDIAELCHTANHLFCQKNNQDSFSWSEAPEWQKESSLRGVSNQLHNPNISCKDVHNDWLKFKLLTGWKYGPIKDDMKKEHPCIVEYEDLPEIEKKKDEIFYEIVKLFHSMNLINF